MGAYGLTEDDPGWQISWKLIPRLLLPQLARSYARKESDKLVALRHVFVAFVTSIGLVGIVVLVLGKVNKGPDHPTAALVVVLVQSVAATALARFVPRPLDGSSPEALALSYRKRFFLRVALAESCALTSYAAYIAFGAAWVYAVGAGFALLGFFLMAPSRAHLRADQDRLSATGSLVPLVGALRTGGGSDAR